MPSRGARPQPGRFRNQSQAERILAMPSRTLALCAALLLSACGLPDLSPSKGECHGSVGGTVVDGPIDAEASYFYRYSSAFRVELSYAGDTLATTGVVPGILSPNEGSYSLPVTDPAVSSFSWDIYRPAEPPALESGTVRVENASDYRMAGRFELTYSDGSAVQCTFDLRRATEREEGSGSSDHHHDWDDWD